MKRSILLFLFVYRLSFSQTLTTAVSGKVTDATTSEPLPSATIRVVGTSFGTITNQYGEFGFSITTPSAVLVISYVGYTSDTVRVNPTLQKYYQISLRQNTIELPGITVTGEDPAYEIIRRAIASKRKWMSQLHSFEGKAFNRTQIRTDSSIAAITEAYSTLFWNRGDSLREVITQQRQTGNMPKNIQPSRVGTIMNFNDDEIRQGGFTFIGPTAPDAFDYYDYKLLNTRLMDNFEVYDIKVIPKSKISPLFKGHISIAERSYAVMNVDLSPNEAFVQPFVKLKNSRYRQSFQLYENKFWLPVNYQFDATMLISLMGITFPALGIERDIVVYDYSINPEFPDSVLLLSHLTIDSSATRYDSAYWMQHDVLPLTAEQDSAYTMLDSTQTLEKKLAPKGATAALLNITGSTLGFANLWFNRVEGFHVGASKVFDNVFHNVDFDGMTGYGFSDHEWKYSAGATWRFGSHTASSGNISLGNVSIIDTRYAIGARIYDTHVQLPRTYYQDHFGNSIAALIDKNDAYDYYRTKGVSVDGTINPTSSLRLTGSLVLERQRTLFQHSNYSFFRSSEMYRPHPAIVDGEMNSILLSASYSTKGLPSLAKNSFSVRGYTEYTSSRLKSDFDFTQVDILVKAKVSTMEQNLLFPPSLSVRIEGGITSGHIPPQRYYSLGSNYYGIVSGDGLHGIHAREFYGDSYCIATVEHNFRRVLFAPLGIEWLMESNLEFIIKGGIAHSWLSSRVLTTPTFAAAGTGGYYYETGCALSNILDFFRADFTWRLSTPKEFIFTVGVSDFLMGFVDQ